MKVCIINGSPRRDGNTEEVLKPFRQRLTELGARVDDIFLKDWRVAPCLECYACQDVQGEYGCVQKDDAEEIFRRIGACDLLVLASPIFTWYCTAEMKALMDRHYGLNKFYRSAEGQLIPKLSIALITTHGYEDFTTKSSGRSMSFSSTYLAMSLRNSAPNLRALPSPTP